MNFYVLAVNALLKHLDDQRNIDIILHKLKSKTVAELELKGMTQRISVSTYRTGAQIPEQFQGISPTVEQLEMEPQTIEVERPLEDKPEVE